MYIHIMNNIKKNIDINTGNNIQRVIDGMLKEY